MPNFDEMTRKRVVYAIPTMEQAQVKHNLTYKTVNDTELKMDVYYPADFQFDAFLPAVIFVHGDAPPNMLENAKDWEQYVSWGQLVAASGLIAVTFTHRSTEGLTRLSDVVSDIDDLIFRVHEQAESLSIDKERLCIWAGSAGVPFGMRVAMEEAPPWVRCIVAYYGPMDMQAMRDLFPAEVTDEYLRELSALYHMKQNPTLIAPLFLAKAGVDRPDLNESINTFVEAALSNEIMLTLMTHPQGQHAFDILDNDARSREIIRATLEFMKTHLLSQ
ncbi:MAG: prolyl oligopeptidase family serine peptidase [Chloroflexota bacterium]|nr:prolyl oligopeptidase family serine peptidase [Chloroflexota bacterium]